MRKLLTTIFLILVLTIDIKAFDVPEASFSSIYCQDFANVLSNETESYLLEKGSLLESKCKAQIVVVTIDSLDDENIDECALKTFNTYGIGDQYLNNGILLFISINDNNYTILSGTGIDDYFTSYVLNTIETNYFEKSFKEKEYDKAVIDCYDALFNELSNHYHLNFEKEETTVEDKGFRIDDHIVSIFALISGIIMTLVVFIVVRVKKLTIKNETFVEKASTPYMHRNINRYSHPSKNTSSYTKRSSATNNSTATVHSRYGGGNSRGTSSRSFFKK